MEVDIMINVEELLIKIVNELPLSEFRKACDSAGINKSLQQVVLDIVDSRGE
jgi:hypothetical protein